MTLQPKMVVCRSLSEMRFGYNQRSPRGHQAYDFFQSLVYHRRFTICGVWYTWQVLRNLLNSKLHLRKHGDCCDNTNRRISHCMTTKIPYIVFESSRWTSKTACDESTRSPMSDKILSDFRPVLCLNFLSLPLAAHDRDFASVVLSSLLRVVAIDEIESRY